MYTTGISDEINSDKIKVEYFNNDFILPNGHFTFDSLLLEINGQFYPANEVGLVQGSYSVEILRPGSRFFKIRVLNDSDQLCELDIELKEDKNRILIKESSVLSLPAFTTKTFEELLPEKISIGGKLYYLVINLAD